MGLDDCGDKDWWIKNVSVPLKNLSRQHLSLNVNAAEQFARRHSIPIAWACSHWALSDSDATQVCIPFPVGCIPPTCWPYLIVSRGVCPPPPPWMQTPWRQIALVMWPVMHAGRPTPTPRGQKEWHTLVKILPCPKLRLQTVKIGRIPILSDVR